VTTGSDGKKDYSPAGTGSPTLLTLLSGLFILVSAFTVWSLYRSRVEWIAAVMGLIESGCRKPGEVCALEFNYPQVIYPLTISTGDSSLVLYIPIAIILGFGLWF
jgi:hypothetical protein